MGRAKKNPSPEERKKAAYAEWVRMQEKLNEEWRREYGDNPKPPPRKPPPNEPLFSMNDIITAMHRQEAAEKAAMEAAKEAARRASVRGRIEAVFSAAPGPLTVDEVWERVTARGSYCRRVAVANVLNEMRTEGLVGVEGQRPTRGRPAMLYVWRGE